MAGSQTSQVGVPKDLNLQGFVPGALSTSTILGVYGGSSLLVASVVWILSGRVAQILKLDRVLMCWWVFTGLTHMILEGYFVFSPNFTRIRVPTTLQKFEYSKGDSRYAAKDAAIVAVEGLTAVLEGSGLPVSNTIGKYAIATRKSYSHILQIAISLGQLYGTAVYFITSYLEGDDFTMNSFYYFAYYIFANSFWVWIPILVVIRSWDKIREAFKDQNQKIPSKMR